MEEGFLNTIGVGKLPDVSAKAELVKNYLVDNLLRAGFSKEEWERMEEMDLKDVPVIEASVNRRKLGKVLSLLEKSHSKLWKGMKQEPYYKTKEALWEGKKKFDFSFEDSLNIFGPKAQKKEQMRAVFDKAIDRVTKRAYDSKISKQQMSVYNKISELKRKAELSEKFDLVQKTRAEWDKPIRELNPEKFPMHGTELRELDEILKYGGVKGGTALDTSPGYEWSDLSTVKVLLPTARKGSYVSHNDYYKAASDTPVAKVFFDQRGLMPEYVESETAKFLEIMKRNPKVPYEILSGAAAIPVIAKEGETKEAKEKKVIDWLRERVTTPSGNPVAYVKPGHEPSLFAPRTEVTGDGAPMGVIKGLELTKRLPMLLKIAKQQTRNDIGSGAESLINDITAKVSLNLLKQLKDIPQSAYSRIKNLSFKDLGKRMLGQYTHSKNIELNPLETYRAGINTVRHEFTHAKQFSRGSDDPSSNYRMLIDLTNKLQVPYYRQPIEIHARGVERSVGEFESAADALANYLVTEIKFPYLKAVANNDQQVFMKLRTQGLNDIDSRMREYIDAGYF